VPIKEKIREKAIIISEFLIPIFQYVPTTSIWLGIMTLPFISYLIYLILDPFIIIHDFILSFPLNLPVIGGLILFIYSLIFLYRKKNGLVERKPYKYVRHPQYLGIIIMTFALTLLYFNTTPIFLNHVVIVGIWIAEVVAYIILAKIEEIHLKFKFGESYIIYLHSVPLLIPFLKLKRSKTLEIN